MAKESIRIVIINDDRNDVSLLRRCLINESGQNYSFVVAKTGEMGIHACQTPGSRRPDCVIVDLHLPDMSGLDVLKRLKDDAGEVQYPVVLFIDSGEECKAATAALRAGAHDYIAKSWLTADGLACAVENAIERFKLQERLKQKRAALERQDREFRALVESVPDIITRFDTEFRHVYINPAIERATGLPPESFLGKTSREAGMPAEFCDFWESVLKEAMVGRGESQDVSGFGCRPFRAASLAMLMRLRVVEDGSVRPDLPTDRRPGAGVCSPGSLGVDRGPRLPSHARPRPWRCLCGLCDRRSGLTPARCSSTRSGHGRPPHSQPAAEPHLHGLDGKPPAFFLHRDWHQISWSFATDPVRPDCVVPLW